jgi:hypothetical protein
MDTSEQLPLNLSALNLRAYLLNAFDACGCSELDKMRETLIRLLEWHNSEIDKRCDYSDLYTEDGIFYLLAGRLDFLGLSEHGGSIRYPWLTENGKKFLFALTKFSAEEIENASGEAYDGIWHGDFE